MTPAPRAGAGDASPSLPRRAKGPLARAASWTLVAATLGFVAWAFWAGWPRLAGHDWDVRPAGLVASTLLLSVVLASATLVWSRVLLSMGAPGVPARTLLRIWFHSNLARYVPGKIWQFVAAADLARSRGLAPATMLVSLVVAMGFFLLGAAVVALAALGLPGLPRSPVTAAVAALAALALVHPRAVAAALRLVPRRAADVEWRGTWLGGAAILGLGVAYWIANGAAFALFLDSVVGTPVGAFRALVGANAAAYLVGYLVVVAPAGLGFREATLTALLGGILGSGLGDDRALALGAVAALASRLWMVIAELIGAAGALTLDAPRER